MVTQVYLIRTIPDEQEVRDSVNGRNNELLGAHFRHDLLHSRDRGEMKNVLVCSVVLLECPKFRDSDVYGHCTVAEEPSVLCWVPVVCYSVVLSACDWMKSVFGRESAFFESYLKT